MVDKKGISFIIVSYKSESLLTDAINSITQNIDVIDFEIVVVDNNSENINFENISKLSSKVVLHLLDNNYGFGYANNYGVSHSNFEIIFLLNLDAKILTPISLALTILDSNRDILLGGNMVDAENITRESYGKFPFSIDKVIFPSRMQYKGKLNSLNFFEVDWIEGSLLICYKKIWNKIGGFDDNIFMYGEDVVLCFEAQNKGIKRFISRDIIYYHKGGYNPSRDKDIYTGTLYFLRKNTSFFRYRIYSIVLTIALAAKVILFIPLSFKDSKYKLKIKSLLQFLFK